MNSYIFDKRIQLKEAPQKVNSVVLENAFNYVKVKEGIHVMGKIGITGECSCDEHCFPFVDTLDIDLIVPGDVIGSLKSLKLVIDNYDYHIVDDCLNFKIKCNLEGYDNSKEDLEIDKAFEEATSNLSIDNKNELLEQFRDTLSNEDEKTIEDLISGKVDVITTTEEENSEHPYIDDKSFDEQVPVDEQTDKIEPVNVINNDVIEDKISEIKSNLNQESEKVTNSNNALFKEERFVVFSSFYRVKKDDTYASIAKNYQIDETHLRKSNNEKELSEGTLLRIPR